MLSLISVILPVYNREAFVADAIQSILGQTYENFELIIIDDASTDSSLSVVSGINDKRIRVLRNEKNLGVSASRNRGIKEAHGKYMAFMDSDDISAPDRLTKQLMLLKERPEIDICGSWVQFLNSDRIIKHQENHEEILTQLLLNCSLSFGSVMVKRKSSNDFLLDESLRFGEDYELWSRVCWNWKFHNIQEPLLFYRIHQDQISGVNKRKQLLLDAEIRLSLFKRIGYCQNSFPDEFLKRIILFNEFFSPHELNKFLNWLKEIERINYNEKAFPHAQLKSILERLKQDLLFKMYFCPSSFGIDKGWRLRSLKELEGKDLIKIFMMKMRQYVKIYNR